MFPPPKLRVTSVNYSLAPSGHDSAAGTSREYLWRARGRALTACIAPFGDRYSSGSNFHRAFPVVVFGGACSQVLNEGTIKLVNARHPVLLLRGKAPVGNDMSLDASMQALILTGPNAGKN